MRPIAFRFKLFTFFLASAIAALATSAAAQKPKVLAPHDPIAPRATTRMPLRPAPGTTAAGPWIVDGHSQSTIFIKNIVETSAITVTPVLHLSDGSEYKLPAVPLEPSGIAKVDIDASLEALGIVPNATLSGWVELQYNWPWNPICAMIRVVDVTRSVVFTFGFGTPESLDPQSHHTPGPQITEGMWWKQEPRVTGFLALANTTSRPITSKIDVSDNHSSLLGTHSITIAPHAMETLDLLELQSASTSAGGIRITYAGEQDALIVSGGLEDIGAGYSANIPFASPPHAAPPMSKPTVPQGIAELALMTGDADPWMHFPSGTVFTPYSVLRNVSAAPISVTPTAWWMQGSTPASFDLPRFTLAPLETRTLNVPALLAAAGLKDFSGSVNLDFDTQGQSGLLLASGAVDQTFNYVFPVVARGIVPSASKSLSYWSTGNGDDTMVTMWNPADEQQSFIFRLSFAGGHYDRLVNLGPRATYMFDVSEIMAAPGPDLDGNVIPPETQEGSAEIVGIEADNQSVLVAVDSSVYNVRKATCYTQCTTCNGTTSYWVAASPFSVAVGSSTGESLQAQWNTGSQYDYTSSATWSSSNTSVATVPSPGQVHGVAPGSFTASANISNIPVYANDCSPYPECPIYGGGGGGGSGDSQPTVSISGPSGVMISNGSPGSPSIQLTASGNPSGGTYSWKASNSDVTLQNASTATVTVLGTSEGVSTLTVTYTLKGQAGTQTKLVTIQQPSYFVTTTYPQVPEPPACTEAGGYGYWVSLNNFVADQLGDAINVAGIEPEESYPNVPFKSYSTPPTTTPSGTFSDTPFGGCYLVPAGRQVCGDGPTVIHQSLFGATIFSISTVYNSDQCTEGISVTISGNLTTQNETIVSGTVE